MRLSTIRLLLPVLAIVIVLVGCGQSPGAPAVTEDPPAAPTNVTATPGPGYVVVSWDDNSDNETGFAVYRDASTSAGVSRLAATKAGEVGPDETRFVDGGASPGDTHAYSVSALGSGGESTKDDAAAPATVPVGIDAMVGTMNQAGAETLGTAFMLFLSFPDGSIDHESTTVTMSGPVSWGEPLELNVTAESLADRWHSASNGRVPVAGTYQFVLDTGTEQYVAEAALTDAQYRFPLPEDVSVSSASKSRVEGSWKAPDGVGSYSVALFESGLLAEGYESTAASAHAFEELTLEAGNYRYLVAAFPVDLTSRPEKIDEYAISYNVSPSFILAESGEACLDAASTKPIVDQELSGVLGEPTCEDLQGVTFVDAFDIGVSNLEGLQYAGNLVELYVGFSGVTDLSPLAGLAHLEVLDVSNSPSLSDISALASLPSLNALNLRDTSVRDISALEGMSTLESLVLEGLGLDSQELEPLSGLTNLVSLDLSVNEIEELSPLAGLVSLHEVFLDWNELTNLWDETAGDNPLLVAGMGTGDLVSLEGNLLDIVDPSSQASQDIAALEANGVTVEVGEQRSVDDN